MSGTLVGLQLINTITLAADGDPVSFTAIDATAGELLLYISARVKDEPANPLAVGYSGRIALQFNADVAANYVNNVTGSAYTNTQVYIVTNGDQADWPTAASAPENFGVAFVTIPDYAGSTKYKLFTGTMATSDGTSANSTAGSLFGQWLVTSPIDQVDVIAFTFGTVGPVQTASGFAAGSQFSLYRSPVALPLNSP